MTISLRPDGHTAIQPLRQDDLASALSAEPILSAVAGYGGRFIDADESIEVDGRALFAVAERLSARLTRQGLSHGDRVLMAVGNGPRFVAALAGLVGAGASPILVHHQTPAEELARTAARYGAAHVLSDDATPEQWRSAEITGADVEMDAPWARFVWGGFGASDARQPDLFPALPGVPLHPTSGTTGLSKLALRPGASAIAEAAHYAETIGVHQRDVILALTPMSHAYAFGMCVMLPLITNATVVSLRRFAAGAAAKSIAEHGVTILPAVPAMLDVLLFGAAARALAAPRIVLSAGAPLSRRTVVRFEAATGRLPCPLYGTTETGGITVATAGVTSDEAGCVGPPMRGVEARVHATDGQSADVLLADGAEGVVGRVEIRSSSMMHGYLGAGGIERSLASDGWFRTGDLGRIGSDGRIHLVGRETDVINVAGMKVVPSEIEDVIGQMPDVIECKVYAGQHSSGSQFVKAAIVAESTADLAKIRAHCEKHLVYYKRPQRLFLLDALPRSAAGKILRDDLP